MIVKVEIQGEVARITTGPSVSPGISMEVPADRVRKRFEGGGGVHVGFFVATEAASRNADTNEAVSLGVLEIGERVTNLKETW